MSYSHLSTWNNYAPSYFLIMFYNIVDVDTVVLLHSFSNRPFLNILCYMLNNSFFYELSGLSYVVSVIGKIRRLVRRIDGAIFRDRFEVRSKREYDWWISRIITLAGSCRSYFSESVTKSSKMYSTIFGIKKIDLWNFVILALNLIFHHVQKIALIANYLLNTF